MPDKDNVIRAKSYAFAIRIVNAYKFFNRFSKRIYFV